MASHTDKKLTLISGANEVKIKNKQTNFQNYLHDRYYLDQSAHPLGLALNSVSINLQFQNPICSIDDSYPQFIVSTIRDFIGKTYVPMEPIMVTKGIKLDSESFAVSPKKWIIKEQDTHKETPSLFDFTNDQKFYLKSQKRYTLTDVYNEWITKQRFVYKDVTKSQSRFGGQFIIIINNQNKKGFYFGDFEKTNATRLSEDVILSIEPKTLGDALIKFFHENFFNTLNVKEQNLMPNDWEYTFDNEKYFSYFNWERSGLRLNINDPGLNFKTPSLMKVVCKQITMIEDDNQYSQVMAVIASDEEDKFKHKNYKFSGEEAFPLQSSVNDHIEILLLDENTKRIILTNSLPTVVTSNAKVMKNDEFHLRFSSDNSKYQTNTPTKFKHLMNTLANVNKEYCVALLSTNFKNEFLPDKSFDF